MENMFHDETYFHVWGKNNIYKKSILCFLYYINIFHDKQYLHNNYSIFLCQFTPFGAFFVAHFTVRR